MTLHTHEQDFRNLITITATARGMRQSFIDKDYWVTWVLRNLADSAVASTSSKSSFSQLFPGAHQILPLGC